jgi:hypothetical protein
VRREKEDLPSSRSGAVPKMNASGKSSSTQSSAENVNEVSRAKPLFGETATLPDEGGSLMVSERVE